MSKIFHSKIFQQILLLYFEFKTYVTGHISQLVLIKIVLFSYSRTFPLP